MTELQATDLDGLRRALEARLTKGRIAHFGAVREDWNAAACEYFWNETHQSGRLDHLRRHDVRPGEHRVLDMAAGCGQFLLAALDQGWDCYGVEPDAWRLAYVARKIELTGRPQHWGSRMVEGAGEHLPYADASFDYVSSFQTLEHVQDPQRVVAELLRVTRPGGKIHLMCPDYRGFFEAHYQLPWLPLFPRVLARGYLRLLGRPVLGLRTIRYTTVPRVRSWFKAAALASNLEISIHDEDEAPFLAALARRRIPAMPGAFDLWRAMQALRGFGRREIHVNLLVHVQGGR